jgi:excisionase family DNA binding protein
MRRLVHAEALDPEALLGPLPNAGVASEDGIVSDGFTLHLPPEVAEAIAGRAAQLVLERLAERDNGGGWPEWMSVETAARYMDVSPERVRKLIAQRRIPFSQEAPGCRVFLRRSALDACMDEATHDRRRPSY